MKDVVDIICWFISLAGKIFEALRWTAGVSMIESLTGQIKNGFKD